MGYASEAVDGGCLEGAVNQEGVVVADECCGDGQWRLKCGLGRGRTEGYYADGLEDAVIDGEEGCGE